MANLVTLIRKLMAHRKSPESGHSTYVASGRFWPGPARHQEHERPAGSLRIPASQFVWVTMTACDPKRTFALFKVSSISAYQVRCGLRILLVCALLAVTQIVRPDVQDAVTTSSSQSRLNDFFIESFEDPLGYSMVLGNAKERVLSRFGEAASQTSSRYPARTSDALLWRTTLVYDGVTFTVGEAEDRTWSWIESIEISSTSTALRFGLRIGASRIDVLEAFSDSDYFEHDGTLKFSAHIWESRTDTKHLPGEVVTVESAMDLTVTIDEDDRISRILIESIEL
jgi:hypothetical protein